MEANESIENRYDDLLIKYKELFERNAELLKSYKELEEMYSENTVIQSMNDMKERYQELMQTTVPKFKYTFLEEKHEKLVRAAIGISAMLDNFSRQLRKDSSMDRIKKIQIGLSLLKEMIDEYI